MTTITEEEDNYVRLSLMLLGLSPRAARVLFDGEFVPSTLQKSLKEEYNKLYELKAKKIINISQWNLLFPRKGVPDSKTFDVTLIITLLRNLTNLRPPNTGFDVLPLPDDTTASADLARIKYYRNVIAHNKNGRVDTSDFTKAWEEIISAVGRLGGPNILAECIELRTKSLERSTVPWNILVQINHELEEWRMSAGSFVETRAAKYVLKCIQENSCVTIIASSGVGKTSILRHVVLQMEDEGYDIRLITSPDDIVKFYNPNRKTLFVKDDCCGTISINQYDLASWESVIKRLKELIQNNRTKIIVACRLQVYQDAKFKSLSMFSQCVCNLLSEELCLSRSEKKSIAEIYMSNEASNIVQYCDLYDCFPLLCKLYSDNPKIDVAANFFKKPYSVFEDKIDKLRERGHYGKYCALALCVIFNNRLEEEWLTEEINSIQRTIIENTCEACRLNRGTSRLFLLDELNSLENTFITKEYGVYTAKHAIIFDIIAFYFGNKIIECLIRNADCLIIMMRFVLERKDDNNRFIIVIPSKYHQLYMERMINDWMQGRILQVFYNINMTKPDFRTRFLSYLKRIDNARQRKLARTCDTMTSDSALFRCSIIGDIPFIQWCLLNSADVNTGKAYALHPSFAQTPVVKLFQALNLDLMRDGIDGASPLLIACHHNHKQVVQLLLDNQADVNKCSSNGINPLIVACCNNYIELVKLLLNNNADPNKCLTDGKTPLFCACCSKDNNIELVNILLTAGADSNKCINDGTSPLHMSCTRNHKDIVQLLLEHKAEVNKTNNDGSTPLFIACFEEYVGVVKILLDYKADPNKCVKVEEDHLTCLNIACDRNNAEIVKLLLDHKADMYMYEPNCGSLLFVSCQKNYINVVKLLLENKADVNKLDINGSSPLLVACEYNNVEVVKLLLNKSSADTDKTCREKGVFPLFVACAMNHTVIVKLLLDNKADINKCMDDGESSLYIACSYDRIEVVKLLLEYKVDVNKCAKDGVSPLFIGCEKNYIEVVKLLLEYKADVNKCRNDGVSPLRIASKNNNQEVVQHLQLALNK